MKATEKQKYQVKWVPCKNISVVWPQAQRPFDEAHAQQLADAFDFDMLDPIKVTLPNGNGIYHAIAGQHRKAAIELVFGADAEAPCIILPEVDVARAAKIFVTESMGQKRPQPVSIFRVKVTAEFETEVAVNKIVTGLGYHIGNSHQDKSILAVAALVSVYRSHGGRILEDTLKIIQATWGMDPNAVIAAIVRGYGAFLVEHGDHGNWQRLKEVIAKKYTPGRFVGAARAVREMEGGNMAEAIKRLLISNYNRGLPAGKHLKSKEAA